MTEQTSEVSQLPEVPQIENKSPLKIVLLVILGLIIVAGAVYAGTTIGKKQTPPEVIPPVVEVSPTLVPIANWKTYVGKPLCSTENTQSFSIKYPPNWILENSTLFPFGKKEDKGLETRLILGFCGREIPPSQTTQVYPSGTFDYYWDYDTVQILAYASIVKNDVGYTFLLENLPVEKDKEFRFIFGTILNTFKFIEKIPEKTQEKTGTIAGKLCYPSDFLPPGEIVAKDISTKELFRQEYIGTTKGGKTTYFLELSPGKYNLRYEAHTSPKTPDDFVSGYYTYCSVHRSERFECDNDQNHKLIDVEIKAGETVSNIDLCDFYYGQDNEPVF